MRPPTLRCFPAPQPLVPTHEQQQSYGLPKPLLRWHDAEPLLEDDERFGRLSSQDRYGPPVPVGLGVAPLPPRSFHLLARHCHGAMSRKPARPIPLATSALPVLACCRERVWRRYVDDEMFNRDHPLMRPRTQRKQQQRDGGDEGAGGPGASGGTAGQRRARPLTLPTNDGGLDKAYQREYIAVDAKRLRRE